MEKIGFIGLGIMGAPMAGHLLDAGYAIIASDHRSKPPADLVAKAMKGKGPASGSEPFTPISRQPFSSTLENPVQNESESFPIQ